eukprot:TRINITY_DN1722_c0_g1_i1.p1 TRINITY_DN1722_c0_g1~~TRINITY_DN1722_c0_g1_i1.p1  ORF type:complete len:565 (-),score=101.83 TRINITY_DN1722_c0_g1_i1:3-1535(-)
MALLLLARRWAQQNKSYLHVLTVDHKLRTESTVEAEQVRRWVKALGVPHNTLTATWHEVPASKMMEVAREARATLLSGACQTHRLDALLLAHHLDDQLETLLMRFSRNSGVNGFQCMQSRSTVAHGLIVTRPLLNFHKAQLIATCHEYDQQFVLDPTNTNLKYARNAVRFGLASLAERSMQAAAATTGSDCAVAATQDGTAPSTSTPSSASSSNTTASTEHYVTVPPIDVNAHPNTYLLPTFRSLQSCSSSLAKLADEYSMQCVRMHRLYGYAEVDLGLLATIPREIMHRVMTSVLMCVSGMPLPPRLQNLQNVCQALLDGRDVAATIAGCLVTPLPDKRLMLCAEHWRDKSLPPLRMNKSSVLDWQGRFLVSITDRRKAQALDRNVQWVPGDSYPIQITTLADGASGEYIVRRMTTNDWTKLLEAKPKRHWKKTNHLKSIPHLCRMSLPLVTDAAGEIIALPYVSFSPHVTVQFKWQPRNPIKSKSIVLAGADIRESRRPYQAKVDARE